MVKVVRPGALTFEPSLGSPVSLRGWLVDGLDTPGTTIGDLLAAALIYIGAVNGVTLVVQEYEETPSVEDERALLDALVVMRGGPD